MKEIFGVMTVVFCLLTSNVSADDVSIDSSGSVKTGVSNTDAELEVTGGSGEGGIRGMTSGTGAAGVTGINYSYGDYGILGYYGSGVYGYSSSGWAGYFEGSARVTGNLTVDGSLIGPAIGDITGITAGAGLSGGGASGHVTLNANTAYLQRRVGWACTAGSSINAINEDGTISCETDDVGTGGETDPEVGSNTDGYIPRWDGSALVAGSIYDNGNIGIGTEAPETRFHVVRLSGDFGAGKASVYGFRFGSDQSSDGGTDWGLGGVDAAMKGYSYFGNQFTAGVAGYNYLDYTESTAVVGAMHDGSNRGMLGYRDSIGDLWAGYFEGEAKVTGGLVAGGGVIFPDGTLQTTAAYPAWYQILPGEERFVQVMNNNEAVLDRETGLVWDKSPGQAVYDWYSAVSSCLNTVLGGRKGWRLPAAAEIATLVDTAMSSPALPPGHPFDTDCASGGCVTSASYWSATASAGDSSFAMLLDFNSGIVQEGRKADSNYVWCVRGGHGHNSY